MRCIKPQLAEQTTPFFVVFSLHAVTEAFDPFFILVRESGNPSRLTVSKPHFKKLRSHKMDKIIHFILVAAMKYFDILYGAVRIRLIRVNRQIFSVSFRTYSQSCHRRHPKELFRINLIQISYRFTAKYLHPFICAADALFRRYCYGMTAALSDDTPDIFVGTFDQRKHSNASRTGRFTKDRYIIGIAAETFDVLMDPLKRHHLIHGA